MLGHNFRHDTIKKYIAVFGTLFKGIEIERQDPNDSVWHRIKVPLSYGPRDKLIEAANKVFGDETQAVALTGPRISFTMDPTPQYDAARKTNTLDKIKLDNNTFMYNAVPYNFGFEVNIIAKNVTDGNRIVEQILPFFAPSLSISMFPLEGHKEYRKDIMVILESAGSEDIIEGDEGRRRSVLWTLRFNFKAFLFSPVTQAKLIKRIEINLKPKDEAQQDIITIQPGSTPLGLPTTDPAEARPYIEVESDDDWAFMTEYEHGQ